MKTYTLHFLIALTVITTTFTGGYAQSVTLKKAEVRPLAGMAKGSPIQFTVLLTVSGSDKIKSIRMEFFSDDAAGAVSLDLTQTKDDDKHFIVSGGAKFPVDGDDIVFIVQAPGGYTSGMRQARITITDQSGSKSKTVTTQW